MESKDDAKVIAARIQAFKDAAEIARNYIHMEITRRPTFTPLGVDWDREARAVANAVATQIERAAKAQKGGGQPVSDDATTQPAGSATGATSVEASAGVAQEVKALADAVDFVNQFYPLPRCHHGNALRDAAGEYLEPSCGCQHAERGQEGKR